MHKIDGANPGPGNTFLEGDPQAGTPATQVTDDWLNAVQAELVNVVEGAGIVLNKPTNTQLLSAIDGFARPPRVFRNVLLNANFLLWNRVPYSNNLTVGQVLYLADRWKSSPGTAGAAASTVARASWSTHAKGLAAGHDVCLRHNQTAVGTVPFLEQRVEDVRTFQAQTAVVSFYAELESLGAGTTLTIATEFVQNFGGGGSADVVTAGPNIVLTLGAGQNRHQASVALPSISAKTYNGINSDTYLAVRLKFQSALLFSVLIGSVQFEAGAAASPFVQMPLALDQLRCARYYWNTYITDPNSSTNNPPGTVSTPGSSRAWISGQAGHTLDTRYPVKMRATPTLTWYSPGAGTAGNVDWEGAARAVTSTSDNNQVSSGYPNVASVRGLSLLNGHFTADAEL
jgi:hypothetical protein